MTFVSSPHVILCGWLHSKHQKKTNKKSNTLYTFLSLHEYGCENTHNVLNLRFQLFFSLRVWVKLHPRCTDWKASFVVCLLVYFCNNCAKLCTTLPWHFIDKVMKFYGSGWKNDEVMNPTQKKEKSMGAITPTVYGEG